MEIEYKITKEQCAKKIKGVCSYCGGRLEPLKVNDGSKYPTYLSGCNRCQAFNEGVDPEIYRTAKKIVEEGFRYHSHLKDKESDSLETKQYKTKCHIGDTCILIKKILEVMKDENK